MSVVKDAAERLEAALQLVPNVRVYRDPGAAIDPPAIVIGPPILRWQTYQPEPTDAAFSVILVETMDERATERLWDRVTQVAAAVEDLGAAVSPQAIPGVFASGGQSFPSYELQTEVAL